MATRRAQRTYSFLQFPIMTDTIRKVDLADLKPHPALSNLLPPLSEEETEALRDSIRESGRAHTPILYWQEVEDVDPIVVDGYARIGIIQAAQADGLEIAYELQSIAASTWSEVEVARIDAQLARRGGALSPTMRAYFGGRRYALAAPARLRGAGRVRDQFAAEVGASSRTLANWRAFYEAVEAACQLDIPEGDRQALIGGAVSVTALIKWHREYKDERTDLQLAAYHFVRHGKSLPMGRSLADYSQGTFHVYMPKVADKIFPVGSLVESCGLRVNGAVTCTGFAADRDQGPADAQSIVLSDLDPLPALKQGDRVRVLAGATKGTEGTVVALGNRNALIETSSNGTNIAARIGQVLLIDRSVQSGQVLPTFSEPTFEALSDDTETLPDTPRLSEPSEPLRETVSRNHRISSAAPPPVAAYTFESRDRGDNGDPTAIAEESGDSYRPAPTRQVGASAEELIEQLECLDLQGSIPESAWDRLRALVIAHDSPSAA